MPKSRYRKIGNICLKDLETFFEQRTLIFSNCFSILPFGFHLCQCPRRGLTDRPQFRDYLSFAQIQFNLIGVPPLFQ